MSEAEIVIAESGVENLDAVMAVMDDSFDPRFGEAWTASQCAGLLPMAGVWLSVAREGESAIGFALARAIAGEAELLLLAVSKKSQGRGVGRKLLEHFARAAAERGATRLHLEVREGNPALSLYRHTQFSVIGRRRNYYSGADGQTYDALTLARDAPR